MKYRKLGRTDISVSVVAMGCWAIVGDETWGPQDEKEAIDAIRAAIDLGVTTFDTAEGYGRGYSEELLAKALGDSRDKAVILSKVSSGHLAPADVKAACEGSLKRLKKDCIDLYQIHWPSRRVPFEDTYRTLERLKEEGKIRAIGVSNFGVEDLSAILELGRVEADQLAYSMLFRAVEHGIRPKCVESEISILPYSPLMQGLLTGKFASADDVPEGRARTRMFSSDRPHAHHGEKGCEEEAFAALAKIREISEGLGEPMGRVALAWLLAQPRVASVLAGARSVAQITENGAAGDLELPADALAALSAATEPVKAALGPNADMWSVPSRIR